MLILLAGCAGRHQLHTVTATDPWQYTINKTVTVRNGAVVAAHPLASATGLAILQQGGNAIDAAIATQLALAVVYPGAGNLGGGGFLVAQLADGHSLAIDYREAAPAKAHRDLYLDAAGNAQLGKSQQGHLAAGVPGTVAGLFASARYGKLPFKMLIQPAINLAAKGFAITAAEANSLNRAQADLIRCNTRQPAFVRTSSWKAGDTLLQPELARTLERIRDKGPEGFYGGETANLLVAEMARGRGMISHADLSSYQAKERTPVRFQYKDYTIITMPLPSSGGILLPQMMQMVSSYPIAQYGFGSSQTVQLMTEIERRAYADRGQYLGDTDFVKVPVQTLTSAAYLQERMKDYVPGKAGNSRDVQAGVIAESEETTHLSVVDKEGNAVAVTTTLNGHYGSRTVVGGAGFLLNNEMDDFSVKPGVPNMYGAIGTEANAIAPGKRMLSSMTPTIVLKNNKPFLVLGTPGGTTIITSVFQTLMNILEFGMNAEDAVNKPKFHHQWQPDELFVEPEFPEALREQLRQMGYTVSSRGTIGRMELIRLHPDGRIEAVADKRGDDHAAGF